MNEMRTSFEAQYTPVMSELGDWWNDHVKYSKFSRQGIDIVCASIEQINKSSANVIIVTGWSDTFLRYYEVAEYLYKSGFNIYMYDHQSHGLSGRWLQEIQSIWINSFDDYVDDFVYYATSINRESPNRPLYVIGYCMGGLIVSIAMSRLPSLVQRAVLISPMLRNKCGIKSFNFNFPLPQPIARWLAMIACWAGLGSMHAFGFFNEKPSDSIDLNITTSDQDQSQVIQSIKSRYPETMSTCVTCDWIYQAIRAQRKFALRYDFVRTNTLIVAAGRDRFVYLRAMQMFQRKTTASRLMLSEEAYHDILHEKEEIRGAVKKVILDFFNQLTDSVYLVEPASPLLLCDRSIPLYSVTESVVRAVGLVFAGIGVVIGTAMVFGTSRRK